MKCPHNPCFITCPEHPLTGQDALEAKCAWQAEMLKRVFSDLLRGTGTTEEQWIEDYEKGPQ